MDPLADAMNVMKSKENVGQLECVIKPASKMLRTVLEILQKNGYVGEYEFVDNGSAGLFNVHLVGRINNCGVVKPRFSVKMDDWTKWEKRYLPSKNVGVLIVSTSQGVMTHKEAKEKGMGGKLLAYIY